MTPNPILILSSGQRTGSTLLQRFILSHPRIMIWGEHDGILNGIFDRYNRLHQWQGMFGHQLNTYLDSGYNNFIPNMTPTLDVIRQSEHALLETLFRDPAAKLGKDIWGFKEVLYDADIAAHLRDLYPDLRVLFITRHPFNCFVSLLHEERLRHAEVNIPLHETWSRTRTKQWVRDWTRINESFLEHPQVNDEWVFPLTYEQLVGDVSGTTAKIAAWLGFPLDEFDLDVFQHRRYTDRNNGKPQQQDTRPKITWDDLSAEEYLLITQSDLQQVAQRLGYEMPNLIHRG